VELKEVKEAFVAVAVGSLARGLLGGARLATRRATATSTADTEAHENDTRARAIAARVCSARRRSERTVSETRECVFKEREASMRDAAGPVTGAAGAARRGGARFTDDRTSAARPAIGGSAAGVAEGDVLIPGTRLASPPPVASLRGAGRSRASMGCPATPDIVWAKSAAADGAADERRASSNAPPAGRGGGGGGGGGVPRLASRGGGGGAVSLSRGTPTRRTEVTARREGFFFASSRSEASGDAATGAFFNLRGNAFVPVTASGDGRLACSLDRVAVSAPALKSDSTRPHFIACAFQSSH
jgi:hypothetical protein